MLDESLRPQIKTNHFVLIIFAKLILLISIFAYILNFEEFLIKQQIIQAIVFLLNRAKYLNLICYLTLSG